MEVSSVNSVVTLLFIIGCEWREALWDYEKLGQQPGPREGTALTGGVPGGLPGCSSLGFLKATPAGPNAVPGFRAGGAAKYAEFCQIVWLVY